jgi:hypothetical protein
MLWRKGPEQMSEPATYISFLVRLWREPGQESAAPPDDWHSEVECIQTGQRWTFTTLDELLDFLRWWVEQREV